MTPIKNLTRRLTILAVLTILLHIAQAQEDNKMPEPPQRPKFAANIRNVNIVAVDNVVTLSFTLLRNVDEVALKVQGVQTQLQGSIPDPSLLMTQIDECSDAVSVISSSSPQLAEDIANMIANIKDLHIPVLKIPSVLKNLNEARKAIQYCVGYTKYIVVTAIPKIKNTKPKADTSVTADTTPVNSK